MSEQDLLLIEQYYRNELGEAERLAFEQRMAEDSDFCEEALLHQRAMTAIRLYGKESFKKRLGERPLIKPNRPYWVWAGFASIFVVLAVVFFYAQHKQVQHPLLLPGTSPNSTTKDSLGQQKPSAFPPDTSGQFLKTQTPQASHQPSDKQKQDLFATVFERHEDAITREAGVRGKKRDNSSLATFQTFLYYYQNRQYPEALKEFQSLPGEMKSDGNSQFYYANALLASGKVEQASTIFDGIINEPNSSDFMTEAQWFSALCALKKGDLPKAKKHLGEVISSDNKTYKPKAAALLRKLSQ